MDAIFAIFYALLHTILLLNWMRYELTVPNTYNLWMKIHVLCSVASCDWFSIMIYRGLNCFFAFVCQPPNTHPCCGRVELPLYRVSMKGGPAVHFMLLLCVRCVPQKDEQQVVVREECCCWWEEKQNFKKGLAPRGHTTYILPNYTIK